MENEEIYLFNNNNGLSYKWDDYIICIIGKKC